MHLAFLAVTARGSNCQILFAVDQVGDWRRADPDAHVIGPDLLATLGIESHNVTGNLAGKEQVRGGGQHTTEHQMIAGILPGDLGQW